MRPYLFLGVVTIGSLLACDAPDQPAASPTPTPAVAGDPRSTQVASPTAGEADTLPTSAAAMSQPAMFSTYGGSASCEECHQEAYDAWKGSHHALAQRGLDDALDTAPFDPPHAIKHASQESTAEFRDGQRVLVTMGPGGEPQPFTPAEVIGVDPLWQYLIEFPDGRLQVTELAWDPAEREWFDVYNDEDRQAWEWGHWTQRGMNWNSMCAECHNTAFAKNYDVASDRYASVYLERGVGCEQCHGPMKDHVDWQEANPDTEGDPTIKPMDAQAHLEVCGSCHARRGNLTNAFMPGDRFDEHFELTQPDLSDIYYPDGQVLEEDFEFAAFTQSYMHNWGVRCTDCHYWHEGTVARTDNQLCQRCHERGISTKRPIDEAEHSHHPEGKEGFNCVDCHMPQTVYMARHWRRDHGMTIPDPLVNKEFGIPDACMRCHDQEGEGLDWCIEKVDEWYGDLMDRPTRHRARLLARLRRGDLDAGPDVLKLLAEEKNPYWRAIYLRFLRVVLEQGYAREQVMPVVEATVKALDDESVLAQAAAVEMSELLGEMMQGAINAKLESPHRMVRIKAAWAARRWLDMDSQAGKELIQYMTCRQDQPLGALQWATFFNDRRQPGEAVAWFERVLQWDSRVAPARHGLATLYQETGRTNDAVEVLYEGSELEPTNSLYPYWLGLLYSEMGDTKNTVGALRAAIARDDQQARYWYNLALAEWALQHHEEAFDALTEAETLEPEASHYPYTRATLLMQLGRLDDARSAAEAALRIAPDHQQAQQLLMQLR